MLTSSGFCSYLRMNQPMFPQRGTEMRYSRSLFLLCLGMLENTFPNVIYSDGLRQVL